MMEPQKNNRLFTAILVMLGVLYFAFTLFQNRALLFRRYDAKQAEKTYGESQWQQSQNISPDRALDQWALQNDYTGWKNYMDETKSSSKIERQRALILKAISDKGVSDSFLYSYVGYRYINGANPSLLNPEHPPLAKYLIGLSIRMFGNEHSIGIAIALISLALVAVISYQITGSLLSAGVSFFLTSIFPLFMDQVTHGPQLELYQLFFFLLVIHFLLMWQKKKRSSLLIGAGICFGLLLSIKTFLPFFVLFSVWMLISFWKQWKVILLVGIVGLVTFILTYYQYFAMGGTLRTFLGLQKYIVTFYGHSSIPLFEFAGNYLRLIFTGSWKFWDLNRSVSSYEQWNILWPILFFIGMMGLKLQWHKHKRSHMLILFVILYNIFVFIVPIFPRYLLLLFIPLIILL